MTPTVRRILAAAAILTAALLCTIHVDREFINLPPTPGIKFAQKLSTNDTYTQSFTTSRRSISRFALYLRPLVQNLPNENIAITIKRNQESPIEQHVSALFLQSDTPVNIELDPAMTTNPGDRITIAVTVPTALSGKVGLQLRQADASFAGAQAELAINGQAQANPAAYEVQYRLQPPLALQLAGLLAMIAIYLVAPPKTTRQTNIYIAGCAIIAALLASVPAITRNTLPTHLIAIQAIVWIATVVILRRRMSLTAATLLAANIIAFSSYLPLHIIAPHASITALSFKDIFLDPNQIAISHAAGSYVGVLASILAVIGCTAAIVSARRHLPAHMAEVVAATIFAVGLVLTRTISPHAIILSTCGIAYFAAYGLKALARYLGPHRLTQVIIWTMTIIVLLDLWHVMATTLEYQLTSL